MENITITHDELAAHVEKYYKTDFPHGYITGYADMIEDLGVCVGVGGISEEDWYYDNLSQAEDYEVEHYNYEKAVLAMNEDQLRSLANDIKADDALPKSDDGEHTLAATFALQSPEEFSEFIKECAGVDPDYYGRHFPELEKEIQESRDSAEQDMRRDFINGDYHGNFKGLNKTIEKELNAEDVDVNKNGDDVTITFSDDVIEELINTEELIKDKSELKSYVLDQLVRGAASYITKQREESAKRKAERERIEAYQKERKARDEAERIAKISAIKK